jgi:hypothetical protein
MLKRIGKRTHILPMFPIPQAAMVVDQVDPDLTGQCYFEATARVGAGCYVAGPSGVEPISDCIDTILVDRALRGLVNGVGQPETPTLYLDIDSWRHARLYAALPGEYPGQEHFIASGKPSEMAARAKEWANQRGFKTTAKGSNIDALERANASSGLLVIPTVPA